MINTKQMNEFLRELLPDRTGILEQLEQEANTEHIPIVEPEVAQLLRTLITMHKPKKVLEIGTAIGYSTICMGQAMANQSQKKIVTIELREDFFARAKENIKVAAIEEYTHLLQGDAREVIPKLKDEKFDFIFCDAAKGQYLEFYDLCSPLLKSGGLLVSDNVLFRGLVLPSSVYPRRKKTLITRLRTYLKMLSQHPSYETSILPIGDGVSISYKKEVDLCE
ncbi:putative O-methyltransferase YrrM [Desulfitispora alkaliphila]|uniref:O-methyltransferase n=1 Tax=Desulfitispora alkaliphila TaxID=622674 RepID=UPI003D1BF839